MANIVLLIFWLVLEIIMVGPMEDRSSPFIVSILLALVGDPAHGCGIDHPSLDEPKAS